jgi:hypothetical protein
MIFVNRDVGPWREGQLAGVLGQPDTTTVRKLAEVGYPLINSPRHAKRGGWVIFADVLDDVRQVVGCLRRPPNPHHD